MTLSRIDNLIVFFIITLLVLCTLDMPYGFYQFTRLSCTVSFSFLSIKSNQEKKNFFALFYATLVILFQPIFPVSFKKEVWNIIDLVIAALLILLMKFNTKKL
jgi:hypothetical protein